MPDPRSLPFTTRLEGIVSRIPLLGWGLMKVQQQVKKLAMRRMKRQDAANPQDLRNFERKVHSQFGEDGISEEIFRRIGVGSKFVVEFGIESGEECNARYFIENQGWAAALFDGSPAYAEAARTLYAGKPVCVLDRFLTTANIRDVFAEAQVPQEFDLLSIDVDGNDYWLWKEILRGYRPRVVVIEYNARWKPPREWVMPYDPSHCWDQSVYYGASLQSYVNLGEENGYTLVACSSTGLNAFFVRKDLLGNHFPSADRGAGHHYAVPLYTHGWGHPVVPPAKPEPRS